MSGSNKPPATTATTISAIGAAAVIAAAAALSALSAYWIASSSSSRREKSKSERIEDLETLLFTHLEDMKHRLDGLEKERSKENNNEGHREGGGSNSEADSKSGGSRKKKGSRRHQDPNNKGDQHSDVDSNANVCPPPSSDEGDSSDEKHAGERRAPLQTIVTEAEEVDRASRSPSPPDDSYNASRGSSRAQQQRQQQQQHRERLDTAGGASSSSTRDLAHAHAPVPVVLISDPGQDLDDEMMFVMARHLVDLDLISLKGVIANLSPSFARARLTRGTLDLLGLHRVPVGIGTDGGDVLGKHSSDQFETTASSYIIHEDGEAARGLESGHRLLQTLYDAAQDIEYVDVIDDNDEYGDDDDDYDDIDSNGREDNGMSTNNKRGSSFQSRKTKKVAKGGLTIVITSSLKDIAIFLRDNPTLFAAKTREVVIMGGCKPVPIEGSKTALAMMSASANLNCSDSSNYSASHIWSNLAAIECEPDSAHNNTFDLSASAFFYSQCQRMGITLTVVSRYAAYAAKMPRSVYDDLALTGSSIGWRLRNSQRASIDQLWQRACSTDMAKRKGLPSRCDRKWFISTFCGGDDDPARCCTDTAWDLVSGFMQYDTIALLAAIPSVREEYFDPFVMPPLVRKPTEVVEGLAGHQSTLQEGKMLGDIPMDVMGDEKTVPARNAAAAVGKRRPPRHRSSRAGKDGEGGRRRSTISVESGDESAAAASGGSKPNARRASLPGPRAIQRAVARAHIDNKYVETPFQNVQNIPTPFDRGTRNLIGISDKEHNLKDPSLLVNLLKTGYREGMLCNHHTQPHIILHLQLRWDNLADTLLTCLMLRSLWDMGLASVLGVIVSICPSDSEQAKRPPDGVSVSDEEAAAAGGDNNVKNEKQNQPSAATADSSDDDIDDNSIGDEEQDDYDEEQSTMEGGGEKKPNPATANCPATLSALAESIRLTLCSIGLSHVRFLTVSGGGSMTERKRQSTEAFRELYESAPPIGVTLVLTATFTSVWPFAESHPDLFRNKTVRVVHTGGALIWPARWGWAALPFGDNEKNDSDAEAEEDPVTSEQILVPDPAAQNHRLDMSSARLFYKRAQALSVPMVILSRHVAKECCIPRNFFDVLGSHGGEVGKRIYENERDSLLNLWRCSCAPSESPERGNLPERCDAKWFAENFCAGFMAGSEEEVWESVEAVNLYSPIALLAALPGETVRSYFQTMPFPVRSATHQVIGLTEEVPPRNVTNPSELRSLIVQSLLSAALANESEFGQGPPPMVPIRMDHEQRRRASNLRSSFGSGSVNGSRKQTNSVTRRFGSGSVNGSRRQTNSVTSATSSFAGTARGCVDDEDMWTFSEGARREIFSRTVAQTSKNTVLPKETKRKFVGIKTTENRMAATNGFIPPQTVSGADEGSN